MVDYKGRLLGMSREWDVRVKSKCELMKVNGMRGRVALKQKLEEGKGKGKGKGRRNGKKEKKKGNGKESVFRVLGRS